MNNKLYIPKKLNVGFNLRSSTYTGRLGYVVYWDDKGKLRKEGSWESWRQKPDEKVGRSWSEEKKEWVDSDEVYGDRVKPLVLDNEPISGFVLNKDAGGVGSGWGWNDRMEKVRVYDPRDFEFEISIPNLLYILQECSSIKGKGLEGEFVYSWAGKELVLLPTHSVEYSKCLEHTNLQAKKVSLRDLERGYDYLDKDKIRYCYIGRDFFPATCSGALSVKKEHIFWDYKNENFVNPPKLAQKLEKSANWAEIIDKFKTTSVLGVAVKEIQLGDTIIGKLTKSRWNWGRDEYIYSKDYGVVEKNGIYYCFNLGSYYYKSRLYAAFELKGGEMKSKKLEIETPKELREATIVFENGAEYKMGEKRQYQREFCKKNLIES